MAPSVPSAVPSSMASAVASSVAAALVVAAAAAVMSATRTATAAPAAGHREHGGGGRAVAGTGRRVGAAISHGRGGGQGRPQQDRNHQQAPVTGFVHPGIMGPGALAQAAVGCGSPERVDSRP